MNIRDSVHGSISLSDEEQKVIAHPLFQRLREIKQLGFLHWIFPGATHTRFEHSLGILFVCTKIVSAIHKNQSFVQEYAHLFEKDTGTRISPILQKTTKALETPQIVSRVRLACLLHDIGHGPFSHASEFLMQQMSWEKISNDWNVDRDHWLAESFKKMQAESILPRHEIFSCLMIRELFQDVFPDDKELLRDVLSIINPYIDPSPDSILISHGVRWLFSDILSGEIDADRIDYLLRDSSATGAKYGFFDVERLLENLCFFVDNQHHTRIAMRIDGLLAFEHFLFSRYQMYLQVYMHRTNQAMEYALKFLLTRMSQCGIQIELLFPKNVHEFLQYTDRNLASILLENIHKIVVKNEQRSELETLCHEIFFDRKHWKTIYDKISLGEDPQYVAILEKLRSNSIPPQYIVGNIHSKNLFNPSKKSYQMPIFLHKEALNNQVVWNKEDLSCLYKKMQGKVFIRRIIVYPNYYEKALRVLSS